MDGVVKKIGRAPGSGWGLCLLLTLTLLCPAIPSLADVPTPNEVLEKLARGNRRFADDQAVRPRANAKHRARIAQEGQHPLATVLCCSDSRVSPELVFDQGLGDLFVVRVTGNVCDVDEQGSIEYGIQHLDTPLLVVLGHTRCGAINTVIENVAPHGAVSRLVDNITPAVEKAQADHPELPGEALAPQATKANVWQSIGDLLTQSRAVRERVRNGKLKIVGAVYDVGTGQIRWMGPHPQQSALLQTTRGVHQAKAHKTPVFPDKIADGRARPSANRSRSAWTSATRWWFVFAVALSLVVLAASLYAKARVSDGSTGSKNPTGRTNTMNWFSQRIGRKLGLGFGLCLTLTLINVVMALSFMKTMNQASKKLYTDEVVVIELLNRINIDIVRYHRAEKNAFLHVDEADFARQTQDMAKWEAELKESVEELKPKIYSDQGKATLKLIENNWAEFKPVSDRAVALAQQGKVTQAQVASGEGRKLLNEMEEGIQGFFDYKEKEADTLHQTSEQGYTTGRILVVGLLVAAMLVGLATAVFITRQISTSLSQIMERMEKLRSLCITNFNKAVEAMEHGDLTAKIETGTAALSIHSKDEFGQLATTFNQMLDQVKATIGSFQKSQLALSDMVRRLQAAAGQVSTVGGALSGAAQQVGASTEQIVSTMQEVASASDQSARGATEVAQGSSNQAQSIADGSEQIKQLAAAVKGVARDAEQATQATADATDAATAGGLSLTESVAGMRRIRGTVAESAQVINMLGESSRHIGTIVQTIDDIADQTNLLALNAAIEAARAGEAGRGFAVVADEVRKLAERSGGATREIGALIDEVRARTEQAVSAMEAGTREVETGTALAEQTGQAFTKIERVIQTVNDRVQGICAAAQQMSAASDEVSRSIAEVAAVVEESSAAAQEMSAAAEEVSASVQIVAGTTQEQGASIEQMIAASGELTMIARDLQAAVAQFRIEEAGPYALKAPALTLLKAA